MLQQVADTLHDVITPGDWTDKEKARIETYKHIQDQARKAGQRALKAGPNGQLDPQAAINAAGIVADMQHRIDSSQLTITQKAGQAQQAQEAQQQTQALSGAATTLGVPDPNAGAGQAAPVWNWAEGSSPSTPGMPPKLDMGPVPLVTSGGSQGTTDADVHNFIQGLLSANGLAPTGLGRTAERNAQVNGVTNSAHLITPSHPLGQAEDIPANTPPAVIQALKAQGLHVLYETANSPHSTGPHWHVDWAGAPPGMNVAQPLVAAIPGAVQAPPLLTPDAKALMGMLPGAATIAPVKLAQPAQMEAMPAAPEQTQLDPHMLDPMIKAMQPVPVDASTRPWDRVRSLLTGIAAGAAQANPSQGLGSFLLHAGLGGSQNVTSFDENSKAEDKAYNEAIRQANIIAEQKKLDFGLKNLDIVQGNKERQYQTQVANQKIKFDNAQSIIETLNNQIKTNLGVSEFNAGAKNQNAMARANVGISALENQANTTNKASEIQTQENQIANQYKLQPKATQQVLDKRILAAGVDPKAASLHVQNAAAAAEAQDHDAAIKAVSGDILSNPTIMQQLTTRAPGDDQNALKFKNQLKRTLSQRKKAGDAADLQAQSLVSSMLQGMPLAGQVQFLKSVAPNSTAAKIIINAMPQK